MIFAPIAYKKTANLSNTVTNLGNAPSTTPGYNFWGYEIDNTSNASTTYLQLFNLPASQDFYNAKGAINWTKKALDRIVLTYFRDEDETVATAQTAAVLS